MPEMPEIEALRAQLAERLGQRVVGPVYPVAVSALKTYDPPLATLTGRTCTAVRRRGKFLDLCFEDLHLVVHLGRAGWLRWRDDLPPEPPRPRRGPLALRLTLAGPAGAGFDLTEAGSQKRLAVSCVRDPTEVPGVARLGPDPLESSFTREVFGALLADRRQQIKGVLRDQSAIAGVGNAYSDEILHVARLSPYRLAASLTVGETDRLYTATRDTLQDAVQRSRAALAAGALKAGKRAAMRVHGRADLPCPECGDSVRTVSFSDSSLQYCPTCQTGGKVLADRRLSRLLR